MESAERLRAAIREIPDFPTPGIGFKDITTLLASPACFRESLDLLQERWTGEKLDAIAGIEARGFIFGAALADRMALPFIPLRKPGKLPAETIAVSYELEYGKDSLEMHADAVSKGGRILIVDDLLATGGTAAAAGRLIREAGGAVAGFAFLVHLSFLPGADGLGDAPVQSLVTY
ncbi:MAG: adenine phosphoribosyltransferase [Gemmatimonadota bacterium]|jgi:adenine phosphoribosyltransferase|nr:adenine phosphoribosyltransferase [Gemmatimonadota bacterium]